MNWRTNTTQDVSGNGNTGTLVGMATTSSPVTGKIGQAMKFDGSTSYVVGSNTVNIARTMVSVWISIPSNPAKCVVPVGFMNVADGASVWDKDVYIDTNGKAYFYIFDGFPQLTSTPSSGLSLNKWHLLTGTADGETERMYVDGVQLGSIAAGDSFTGYSGSDIFVGGTASAGNSPGAQVEHLETGTRIDDVRIYNRALSATEIQQLYTMGR